MAEELEKLLRTGDFDLPPCERLAERTWERSVAPIADAVKGACVAPRSRR